MNAAHYATFVSTDPEAERKKWDDPALAYPTKCVDCERRFIVGERWRGQQTKCFSCEAMAAAAGAGAGSERAMDKDKDGQDMAGYVEIDYWRLALALILTLTLTLTLAHVLTDSYNQQLLIQRPPPVFDTHYSRQKNFIDCL